MNIKVGKALGIALDVLKIGGAVAGPAVDIIKTVRGAVSSNRDLTDGELDKIEAYRKKAEDDWGEQVKRYGAE